VEGRNRATTKIVLRKMNSKGKTVTAAGGKKRKIVVR
jgi:hypothetical protein